MAKIRIITAAMTVIIEMAATLKRTVITANAITPLTTNRIALRSKCIFNQVPLSSGKKLVSLIVLVIVLARRRLTRSSW
jgi:hypothetical protein